MFQLQLVDLLLEGFQLILGLITNSLLSIMVIIKTKFHYSLLIFGPFIPFITIISTLIYLFAVYPLPLSKTATQNIETHSYLRIVAFDGLVVMILTAACFCILS